jgi:hypothetical protein
VASLAPQFLIVISTDFQRQQGARARGRGLVFDTTFNIGVDNLLLSTFVVRSASMRDMFFPVMYALHRAVDAAIYRSIFRALLRTFGIFGADQTFIGVSVDFADAIQAGYLLAWFEYAGRIDVDAVTLDGISDAEVDEALSYLRKCRHHFSTNLKANLNDHGVDAEAQEVVFRRSGYMLDMAEAGGWQSAEFLDAQRSFLDTLAGAMTSVRDWASWWVEGYGGTRWRCLVDVGPDTVRHLLEATTNAIESQHRVMKYDHVLRSGEVIDEVIAMQRAKDEEYAAALLGQLVRSRSSGMKVTRSVADAQPLPRPKPRKRYLGSYDPQLGPPRRRAHYKRATAAAPTTRQVVVLALQAGSGRKSFVTWPWSDNSCPFDAALAVLFVAFRRSLKGVLIAPHSIHGTRQSSVSAGSLGAEFQLICERLGHLWRSMVLEGDAMKQLGIVRDGFRDRVRLALGRSSRSFGEFDSVVPILELVAGTLSSDTVANPSQPVQGTQHEAYLVPLPREPIPPSLQSVLDADPPEPGSTLLLFEFIVFQGNKKVGGVAQLDAVDVPLQLHAPSGDVFHFIACVDSNSTHFRAHVMVDGAAGLSVGGRCVADGLYLFDPKNTSVVQPTPRAVRSCPLPSTADELRRALPRFRGGSFAPHVFVYLRAAVTASVQATENGNTTPCVHTCVPLGTKRALVQNVYTSLYLGTQKFSPLKSKNTGPISRD